MKRILTLVALTLTVHAFSNDPDKVRFDLQDPAQVRKVMAEFVQTLKEKDFDKELLFRETEVLWWYKSIDNSGTAVPGDSSLAYIGFLDSLHMADELQIDMENRLVMRTFYVEPGNHENKHRYAFYINEEGRIGGILYVPPLTTEYFPNWTEEEFRYLAENLESTVSLGYDEIMWGDIEFASFGCGGVMPLVQDLEALAKEESVMEKEPSEEEDIMEVNVISPSNVPYRRGVN